MSTQVLPSWRNIKPSISFVIRCSKYRQHAVKWSFLNMSLPPLLLLHTHTHNAQSRDIFVANCWHSREEEGKIFGAYVLMIFWVKTDKSRNKVTLNVFFSTLWRTRCGEFTLSSRYSESLHQKPTMNSLVTSMQLNRYVLALVLFEG